jgi:dTDP-4-amino-4,6-dideoxygalactose transaminase
MINVTKAYLPELERYLPYLETIWRSGWVTNNGQMVRELEARLKDVLGVKHLFYVNNGTIALQLAIKALELQGEVLTTPFSYVATTSSLVWEGCKPVFVDIDPETLCIDPERLEAHITPRTSAILGVHVYGNPCATEAIEAVAKRHGLKVIYDAAHAFGVRTGPRSVLEAGDISTLSFHATKLFHTIEGGAVVTSDDALAHRISYLRNFGHDGPEAFQGLGINGKSSELHAAMGLCVLPDVPDLIARRRQLSEAYDARLLHHPELRRPTLQAGTTYNYAYYPIVLSSEQRLLDVTRALAAREVTPRRYFYPSLHTLPYVEPQAAPVSADISTRVLCLPLYPQLSLDEVERIADGVLEGLGEPRALPRTA